MKRTAIADRALTRYLVIVLLVVAYAAILHWFYETQVAPRFSYLGQRYRQPDATTYGISIALTAMVALFLPWRVRRPSQFVLWLLFIMVGAPTMLVPQYADIIPIDQALELTAVAAAAFAVLALGIRPKPGMIRVRVPPHLVWFVIFAVSVFAYGYMLMTTGLAIRFVALGDVQALRFAYRDELQSAGGGLLGYVILLQGNVVNPTIMARGLYAKRWSLILVGAVGQLLIFSVTGFKLTLLSVPAFIALAIAYRRFRVLKGATLLAGVMGAAGAALLVDWIQGANYYVQIFVNRLLLTPGTLSAAHVMVFDEREKAMWGHSFLSGIVDYPYSVSPPFLVGTIFHGDPRTSANANFIGDGFANLGYTGVFIEALVLVLILRLLDATGRGLPIAVTSIIVLVPTLATANAGAFTSLLTGGYLAAMMFMATLPRTGWARRKKQQGARRRRVAYAR